MSTLSLFKWRHFLPEIILLNVRWYCRYLLSYRDARGDDARTGVKVDHANGGYSSNAPELDQRVRSPQTDERLMAGG